MTGIALSAAEATAWGRRLWTFLRREPLVHFLVLGALLFGADGLRRSAERETILIDRPTMRSMLDQQTQVLGRPPTDAERAGLVQGAVDDAVLLREAYERGLEQDSLVEQHLVQKMRFLLTEDLPEPGEAELRAWFAAHADSYRDPATVTLDQIYFVNAGAIPDGLLERLRGGAEFQGLGDRLYMLGPRLTGYSTRDLGDLLGADNAKQIFDLPPGEWQGPLRSAEGLHFVRVAAREPARLPAFEEIENSVRENWRRARQNELVAARVAELRQRYRIVVEPGEGAP